MAAEPVPPVTDNERYPFYGPPKLRRNATIQTYGWERARWGPYWRQAVRLVGRTLERRGQQLDSWSWRP